MDHYNRLVRVINYGVSQVPPVLDTYEKAGRTQKRYRWDLLFYSLNKSIEDGSTDGVNLMSEMYRYMNDSHIDTALRRITRTK